MTSKSNLANGQLLSPCVDNCCLDENDICLGCERTLDEILAWRQLSDFEKTKIIDDCKIRQEQRKQALNRK